MITQKIDKDATYLAQQYLQGKTLQEIANEFGCSRERVRQVLVKAGYIVRTLKNYQQNAVKNKHSKIADEVLIESTNRVVEHLYKRDRWLTNKLSNYKKYHSNMMKSYYFDLSQIIEQLDKVGSQGSSLQDILFNIRRIAKSRMNKMKGKYETTEA